ncbi:MULTISPECIES: hypothetical protein [unclassified Microbacterium]|uniref:hypothetical protein n=1 Tax=unclassified Microbacterium TaxID=2609290 RepID=UPI000C2C8417|nr:MULTISPECIES: hypothetical protein [unclassified Microbacterium]
MSDPLDPDRIDANAPEPESATAEAEAEPATPTGGPATSDPAASGPAPSAPAASAPPLPPYAMASGPAAGYPGAAAGYPGGAPIAGPPMGAPLVQPYPGAPPTAAYGAGHMPPPMPGAVPPPGGRPKALAIIALVLAVIGLVMAFIPFVTWFSGFVLLAGFVVALIALIKKTQGANGLSIAALVISVVGWIVSVVMSIASFAILADATTDEMIPGPGIGVSEPPVDDDEASDPAGDAQDLVVVESAFGRTSYDPTIWWYVLIIENPNTDYVFDFAAIDVEALSADGTILDTSSSYPTILSGTTAISGIFTDVGQGEIVELDGRGPDAAEAIPSPFDETGSFLIDGVTAASDDFSTTVTGTVSGTFESDQEFVSVVVVARAPDGRILGAESAYVDRLPSDGTKVQFEAMFFDVLPADTTFEAFASL